MNSYVALLRGINVSGQKLIKMAELKTMFEKLGFENVATYIQSGNVVFSSGEKEVLRIQQKIKQGILKSFGFDVDVQVLDAHKLKIITENHSFLEGNEEQLKFIYYTLLAEKPKDDLVDELNQLEQTIEFFKITDEVIYCFYPNGYGNAKWHNVFFEKKLKVSCTTRNYNTMLKLTELSEKD
ncbi:MAG: DUF1697 domain-containing protein [Flavobacteriales bacterium]